MFRSIVVGTDGSDTAHRAVAQAVDLAKALGARLEIVCAYEPVSGSRLREERGTAPADLQWMVNAREDVDATLREAVEQAELEGLRRRPTRVGVTRPTRSSTSPRSAEPISSSSATG